MTTNRDKRTSEYAALFLDSAGLVRHHAIRRELIASRAARADKLARDNAGRDYFTRDTRKVSI